MLIGLARPKKGVRNPQALLVRRGLSDQVVVITEESDFFILVIVEINYMTQRKEKKGICKSFVIATVVAIRDVVKNGFHCIYPDYRHLKHNDKMDCPTSWK